MNNFVFEVMYYFTEQVDFKNFFKINLGLKGLINSRTLLVHVYPQVQDRPYTFCFKYYDIKGKKPPHEIEEGFLKILRNHSFRCMCSHIANFCSYFYSNTCNN